MNREATTDLRRWPFWLGIAFTVTIVAASTIIDANSVAARPSPSRFGISSAALQPWLRVAFLLIAVGALSSLRLPLSAQWRWAVGSALVVLACAAIAEAAASIKNVPWMLYLDASLGPADSQQRRLFRLGAMSAFAVPMLVLLAAAERAATSSEQRKNGFTTLLVRWEPTLFAVGVSTLAGSLMAAAFIHQEFTWAAPIGADTTAAACAAATIRARWRADSLAFGGWLLVCIGMAIGLVMGVFAFGGPVKPPAFLADYNALPRIMIRDAHVALLAIGIIGVSAAAARRARGGKA